MSLMNNSSRPCIYSPVCGNAVYCIYSNCCFACGRFMYLDLTEYVRYDI